MNMNAYSKKIAGTSALILMAAASVFAASPGVFAKFINFGSYYTADGTVTAVGAGSFTMATQGTNAITMAVNGSTRFFSGGLSDMHPGDKVVVKFYSQGSSRIAQTVKVDTDGSDGYGSGGNRVFVQWSYVKAKTGSGLTVNIRPGVDATFAITPGTVFQNMGVTNLAQLGINDAVAVSGTEGAGNFTATRVQVLQHAGKDVFAPGNGDEALQDEAAADADSGDGWSD